MAPIPSSPIKKAKFKHSTPRKRNRIVARYNSSLSAKAVAHYEGVTEDHVRGVIKRFTAQDYSISRPGRGRPPKLSERDKRLILRKIGKNAFIQIETLRRLAYPYVGRTCLSTFLKKQGISHHLAATRPYLSKEHTEGRYIWAVKHSDKPLSF
jgi:transposase